MPEAGAAAEGAVGMTDVLNGMRAARDAEDVITMRSVWAGNGNRKASVTRVKNPGTQIGRILAKNMAKRKPSQAMAEVVSGMGSVNWAEGLRVKRAVTVAEGVAMGRAMGVWAGKRAVTAAENATMKRAVTAVEGVTVRRAVTVVEGVTEKTGVTAVGNVTAKRAVTAAGSVSRAKSVAFTGNGSGKAAVTAAEAGKMTGIAAGDGTVRGAVLPGCVMCGWMEVRRD